MTNLFIFMYSSNISKDYLNLTKIQMKDSTYKYLLFAIKLQSSKVAFHFFGLTKELTCFLKQALILIHYTNVAQSINPVNWFLSYFLIDGLWSVVIFEGLFDFTLIIRHHPNDIESIGPLIRFLSYFFVNSHYPFPVLQCLFEFFLTV